MEGFTVGKANQFLNSAGGVSDLKTSVAQEARANGVQGTDVAGKSFADTLNDAVGKVNELQKTADKEMQKLATGQTDNIPEVMIAAEKADIALRLMMQMRNKIIDAYQDVMKMQV